MRECLTTATPKYSSEVEPLLIQAFPVGQTRWISAPPSMAQDRSGLQWVAHRDSAPGPQLPPQAAISQLYLLLPHFQKQGKSLHPWERCRVSPPCLEWSCSGVSWHLGMSFISMARMSLAAAGPPRRPLACSGWDAATCLLRGKRTTAIS